MAFRSWLSDGGGHAFHTRALTAANLQYRNSGLEVLRRMLGDETVMEAPEIQAVYNWCLEKGWEIGPDKLEEVGPVVGMGMAIGDLIAAETGMVWVWLTDEGLGWSGPVLQLPEHDLYCYPVPMLAGRLHERVRINVETLIRDTIASVLELRGRAKRLGS